MSRNTSTNQRFGYPKKKSNKIIWLNFNALD
nr:MAG TPA: hypothetical protein [Microviridae sp.]